MSPLSPDLVYSQSEAYEDAAHVHDPIIYPVSLVSPEPVETAEASVFPTVALAMDAALYHAIEALKYFSAAEQYSEEQT